MKPTIKFALLCVVALLATATRVPYAQAATCATDDYDVCGNCQQGDSETAQGSCCVPILLLLCGAYDRSCRKPSPNCCSGFWGSQCTDCPAGSQCPGGINGISQPCAPGTFSTGFAAACSACPANQYQPKSGATSCVACPSFSTSTEGSAKCTCNAGRYGINTNTTNMSCSVCEPGFQCSNSIRTACPAGSVQPSSAGSSCTACLVNQYQNATGQTSCKPCPTFSTSSSGAARCTCDAGRYMVQDTCQACEPGFYCPGDNTRYACPANTYQASSGSSSCPACPDFSTSFANSVVCTCDSGRYLDVDSGMCVTCPAGSRCATNSNTRTLCSAGQYQDEVGQTSCKVCPDSSWSTANATGCTCNVGLWMDGSSCSSCAAGNRCIGDNLQHSCDIDTYQDQAQQSTCASCPVGSTATSGSSGCTCGANYASSGAGSTLHCTLLGALSVAPMSRLVYANEGDFITLVFSSTVTESDANCTVLVLGTSSALAGHDYNFESSLTLFFDRASGNGATLNLTIPANNLARPRTNLYLRLANPNGAILDTFTDVHIAIQAANIPSGAFEFSASNRTMTVAPLGSVVLTLERIGGSDGTAQVSVARSDSQPNLVFNFASGQTVCRISMPISSNDQPALGYNIQLSIASVVTSVLPSEMGTFSSAELVVQDTVDAHGVLAFSAASFTGSEESGAVVVTITRARGLFGSVSVRLTTSSGTALEGSDFVGLDTTIVFDAGVSSVSTAITVIDDTIPELAENFVVALSSPTGGAILSSSNPIQTVCTISENDDARGVLSFERASLTVDENVGQAVLTVLRTGGAFGSVTGFVLTVSGTATAGTDFVALPSLPVVFPENVTAVNVSVTILNDDLPELDESFVVSLSSNGLGGVRIGAQASTTVTIRANDNYAGLFSFDTAGASADVAARTTLFEGSSFNITVLRNAGLFGAQSLTVKSVYPYPETSAADVLIDSQLDFADGERIKVVTITVPDQGAGERPARRFDLQLSLAVGSLATLSGASAYMVIEPVSTVGGVVGITVNGSSLIAEGSNVTLTIARTPNPVTGTLPVSVYYRTVFGNPSSVADGTDADDLQVQQGLVTFQPNQYSTTIQVTTIQDSRPEQDEIFYVELFDVSGMFISQAHGRVAVTIAANDNAYGVVSFANHTLTAVFAQGWLRIPVVRTGGVFRDTQVTIEQNAYAIRSADDQGREGSARDNRQFVMTETSVTIPAGSSEANFNLWLLNPTDLQHTVYSFTLNITGATNGTVLSNGEDELIVTVDLVVPEAASSQPVALIMGATLGSLLVLLALGLLLIAYCRRREPKITNKSSGSLTHTLDTSSTILDFQATFDPVYAVAVRQPVLHSTNEMISTLPAYAMAIRKADRSVPVGYDVLQPVPAHAASPSAAGYALLQGATEVGGYAILQNSKVANGPQRTISERLYGVASSETGAASTIRENLVLGNPIGDGFFGQVVAGVLPIVYASRDLHLNPIVDSPEHVAVAVKLLKVTANEKDQRDFRSEASMMVQFNHANIVTAIGALLEQQPNMLVLEFMPYGDLQTLLVKCSVGNITWTPREVAHAMRQVASAMDYLARQQFVHRDLAARNCLVGPNLTVKLADFGLARRVDSGCYQLQTRGRLPVRWLAIESIGYLTFTTESDVWSYGVLGWEVMSYGLNPYANLPFEEMLRHLESGARLPQPDTCPVHIWSLLRSCWEPNPADRPIFPDILTFWEEEASATVHQELRDLGKMVAQQQQQQQ
ncbi:ephrin type-A receptor 4a [Capsaspora owczarzaki ATCC 30864]|uniref:TKL protein kinase n=1 Tax=Capsaspora owczarzaki (strain ATCC 30864) TaxID=595528 RepID=A0A0D2W1A9_CAPO3|nr:ephrin type-A receptor 4a [Capsaspora owczarzaki ATCC 30864]KJE98052.1 TKL protein kinase [Capsaspora owczarzaki ATCC 30864]|eukprot:XP_004342690.1 ephrin type-A receptor 4a [Capsaspora owczarzaki ATCC 30864]